MRPQGRPRKIRPQRDKYPYAETVQRWNGLHFAGAPFTNYFCGHAGQPPRKRNLPEDETVNSGAKEKGHVNNGNASPSELCVCGARGSFVAPGAAYAVFGHNTSCYALRFDNSGIIVDCGTGLLAAESILNGCRRIDVLFTHFHYDHVLGLLCAPWLLRGSYEVHMWGYIPGGSLLQALSDLARPPYWPVPLSLNRCYTHDLHPGDSLMLPTGAAVRTMAANHPDGGLLYRVTVHEKSVVFAFDHEHGATDAALASFASLCNLLVYDGMFDAAEYAQYEGWGHSSYERGLHLMEAAAAEKLLITHHAPWHTDVSLTVMEHEAQHCSPNCSFAREGRRYRL